jgi:hypothetical protein
MPIDSTKQYEEALRKATAEAEQQIRKIYERAIIQISLKASTVSLQDKPFALSLYPILEKFIDSQVDQMHKAAVQTIVDSVKRSWDLSNKKNDQFIDKRLAGKNPKPKVNQILYDPNNDALSSFIQRKEKGLNLSSRVWNSLDTFKKEMEQGLGVGIGKGQSALSLASEIKQYLNNPDKLFRRVKNDQGQLALSNAAKNFHPGQGIYRSSYKNSLRLTRTETNIAYRSADHVRWQKLPFVVGIEIKTSNNHPQFDICDKLKGEYPKDFKFTGWHPQCRCYQVPKLMTDSEYDKFEDSILNDTEFEGASRNEIVKPPDAFGQFLKQNSDRIAGWSNKPYWLKDNPEIVKEATRSVKTKLEVDFSVLNLSRYISRISGPGYQNVLPELSKEEKASINGYTDGEYFSLNSYLRGLNVSATRKDYFDNYRNLLNNALDEIPNKFVGAVFGGTTLDSKALKEYKDALKTGDPITHDYFTSASKDPGASFGGNTKFIIHSKTGRLIESISEFSHEKEVLFKAGTKFKVKKVEKRSDGFTYISLDEV